jgi:hypothetical protein
MPDRWCILKSSFSGRCHPRAWRAAARRWISDLCFVCLVVHCYDICRSDNGFLFLFRGIVLTAPLNYAFASVGNQTIFDCMRRSYPYLLDPTVSTGPLRINGTGAAIFESFSWAGFVDLAAGVNLSIATASASSSDAVLRSGGGSVRVSSGTLQGQMRSSAASEMYLNASIPDSTTLSLNSSIQLLVSPFPCQPDGSANILLCRDS